MKIEDKAKAYDEMVQRVKELHETGNFLTKKQMEIICPELAESEDEGIRKELVAFFIEVRNREGNEGYWHDLKVADILAYLEKQKINTEGDFGRGYDRGYQAGYAVAKNEMKSKVATATLDSEKQKEQKPIEKISVSEELYEHIRNACACIEDAMSSDTLCDMTDYLEMADSSAKKAFDMVERSVVKQPAKWSEEDEKIRQGIIKDIEFERNYTSATTGKVIGKYNEQIAWLKSLRPQPHWKPSEDEERLIKTSISFLKDFADKGYENAVECIDWLKSKLNGNSC